MEAFFPIDNSFFKIVFDGLGDKVNISEDVIQFSVTEELHKMITGTITLKDSYHIYSRHLKNGRTFTLSWGYKKRGVPVEEALKKNPEEITGNIVRTNLKCFIQSPSGGGTQNGVVTYNCSFYGSEMKSNLHETQWFRTGTKKIVINTALAKLGVSIPFIDFNTQTEQLGETNAVMQNETTFKFLNRLASEWRCSFKTGHTVTGQLAGLFIDNTKIDGVKSLEFQKATTGANKGKSKLFEYGINSTYPNVINYTWKHHIGDSGMGDGNRIDIINGKEVITNYTVEDQVVTISRLSEAKLKEYIKTHPDQKDLLRDIIKANAFTDKIGDTTVGYFFDFVETTTAPQGLGYSTTVQVLGDPLLTSPMKATLGNGFPDFFKNDLGGLNKFFIQKITHNINSKGYQATLEIADAITAFGSFVS
jgi:hypothetical protein